MSESYLDKAQTKHLGTHSYKNPAHKVQVPHVFSSKRRVQYNEEINRHEWGMSLWANTNGCCGMTTLKYSPRWQVSSSRQFSLITLSNVRAISSVHCPADSSWNSRWSTATAVLSLLTATNQINSFPHPEKSGHELKQKQVTLKNQNNLHAPHLFSFCIILLFLFVFLLGQPSSKNA